MGRNNRNRPNPQQQNLQKPYVDESRKTCHPITKGAASVIFCSTGGEGHADIQIFVKGRKKIALAMTPEYPKGGAILAQALQNFKEPIFELPPELAATATEAEKKTRELENEFLWKQRNQYVQNNQSLFWRLLSHCTETLQGDIEKMDDFEAIKAEMNGVKLALRRLTREVQRLCSRMGMVSV